MGRGGNRIGSGRKKGALNKTTEATRALGAAILSDELEAELWNKYLNHSDKRIAWEAFKMAKEYKSGKPTNTVALKQTEPIVIKFVREPETPAVQFPATPQL